MILSFETCRAPALKMDAAFQAESKRIDSDTETEVSDTLKKNRDEYLEVVDFGDDYW